MDYCNPCRRIIPSSGGGGVSGLYNTACDQGSGIQLRSLYGHGRNSDITGLLQLMRKCMRYL